MWNAVLGFEMSDILGGMLDQLSLWILQPHLKNAKPDIDASTSVCIYQRDDWLFSSRRHETDSESLDSKYTYSCLSTGFPLLFMDLLWKNLLASK